MTCNKLTKIITSSLRDQWQMAAPGGLRLHKREDPGVSVSAGDGVFAHLVVVMLGITRMVRRRGRSERAQLRRVRRDARCREMGLRRILAHMVAMGEVIGVDPAEHPQVRTVANLIDTARGNELFGVWPW
ncbi:hypothetical protein ACIBJF_30215 [Streptomyces sp. NPDC050743]|uniref:hypothetical protein n=1 Tax=Streptomyces sp. NPDC050743 TaxID=3365634 RepID=UPI00378C4258